MPQKRPLPLLVRILGGALLGFAIWSVGGPLYHPALTSIDNFLIRAFENPKATQLIWHEDEVVINREDFPPQAPRPNVLLPDLTFNIILLTVLFAVPPTALSDKNVLRYFIALGTLIPIHLFALIAEVESIYALRLGIWSSIHYGPWARNFWPTFAQFYQLLGVHGIAVVLWLIYSDDPRWWQQKPAAQPRAKKR